MADPKTASSSVSSFVTTLIFNGVIALVFTLIFILLKDKFKRVYQPRATVDTVPNSLKTEPAPKGPIKWIFFILSKPDSYVIEKAGVDGYFFLRYLKTFFSLGCLAGVVVFPVLFAVNATGGGTAKGFDIISYANITGRWRPFAHLFLSWFFFGMVIYTIYKELVYYVSFRHALQTTPLFSSLPQSRTLCIDNLPKELLNDDSLFRLFPAAKRIWFTRETKELQTDVKKRTKLGNKLEGGINAVIKKAIKLRAKAIKKGKPTPDPSDEIVSYIPEKKLPTYKDKPIPFLYKKKKLFTEGIDEVAELNVKVKDDQEQYPDSFDKTGSVFIEFATELEAQRAYQAVPYAKELKLSRRFLNVPPSDIVWENAGVGFAARKTKYAIAATVLTLTIIFWSIPVGVVGAISNINFLTDKVHFLRFINNMPKVLLGIITGLLPTVALAVLMSLLPPFIRKMGKVGGCTSVQDTERWLQQWFFAFQVVQVFLVTTCTSAAASTVTKIISDPSSALSLLGQNLPPAANFYISYLLLQGLSISSGFLAQIVALILSFVLGRILDGTPRKKWNRYNTLSAPSWGTTYALYGFFTVILLVYSIIAPIIIAFACVAYFLIYLAFLYNLTYVNSHAYDNRGRNYPLALFEVFVGLYLAEICLTALFVMRKNWPCVILEAIMIGVTIAAHLYFRWTFEPLIDTVPVGAFQEADSGISGAYIMKDQGKKQIKTEGENYFAPGGANDANYEKKDNTSTDETSQHDNRRDSKHSRGLHSIDGDDYATTGPIGDAEEGLVTKSGQPFPQHQDVSDSKLNLNQLSSPTGLKAVFLKYFQPRKYLSFNYCRSIMPHSYNEPVAPQLSENITYDDPASVAEEPHIWFLRDSQGLSSQFLSKCEGKVLASDNNAVIEDDSKFYYTGPPPDYEEPLPY